MFVSASLARIHRAAVSRAIASIALGILLFFASPLTGTVLRRRAGQTIWSRANP